MTTSMIPRTAAAEHVRVTDRALIVELRDGRVVSVPLRWYPRLAEASPRERRRWELLGPGIGIHWPDLDEDISVEGLLGGSASGESATSLNAWRARRKKAERTLRSTSRSRTRRTASATSRTAHRRP